MVIYVADEFIMYTDVYKQVSSDLHVLNLKSLC